MHTAGAELHRPLPHSPSSPLLFCHSGQYCRTYTHGAASCALVERRSRAKSTSNSQSFLHFAFFQTGNNKHMYILVCVSIIKQTYSKCLENLIVKNLTLRGCAFHIQRSVLKGTAGSTSLMLWKSSILTDWLPHTHVQKAEFQGESVLLHWSCSWEADCFWNIRKSNSYTCGIRLYGCDMKWTHHSKPLSLVCHSRNWAEEFRRC